MSSSPSEPHNKLSAPAADVHALAIEARSSSSAALRRNAINRSRRFFRPYCNYEANAPNRNLRFLERGLGVDCTFCPTEHYKTFSPIEPSGRRLRLGSGCGGKMRCRSGTKEADHAGVGGQACMYIPASIQTSSLLCLHREGRHGHPSGILL
jgi:hypothetical protein